MNGDSYLDLVTANAASNDVSVLLGDGSGSFAAAKTYAVGTQPISVAVGDFNGDRKPDLAVANQGSGDISVLLGDGVGSFAANRIFAIGDQPYAVAAGNFNGDKKTIWSPRWRVPMGSGYSSTSRADQRPGRFLADLDRPPEILSDRDVSCRTVEYQDRDAAERQTAESGGG